VASLPDDQKPIRQAWMQRFLVSLLMAHSPANTTPPASIHSQDAEDLSFFFNGFDNDGQFVVTDLFADSEQFQ
jgi:hypothetical protein